MTGVRVSPFSILHTGSNTGIWLRSQDSNRRSTRGFDRLRRSVDVWWTSDGRGGGRRGLPREYHRRAWS